MQELIKSRCLFGVQTDGDGRFAGGNPHTTWFGRALQRRVAAFSELEGVLIGKGRHQRALRTLRTLPVRPMVASCDSDETKAAGVAW